MDRHASTATNAILSVALLLVAGSPPAQAQAPPALVATPATLDAGTLPRNGSFHGTIVVRNASSGEITISGITATPGPELSLSVDNGCRRTLLPARTCSINVQGSVRGPGTYLATLKLASDDPASPLVMHVRAIVPDAGPPVMQAPPRVREMARAYRPPNRLARLLWTWRATDDDEVSGFTAQMRVGRGAWKTFVRPDAAVEPDGSQQRAITHPTGKQVTIRTRAHDPAGKVSDWTSRSVRISYRDIQLGRSLTDKWRQMDAPGTGYGGGVVLTRHDGATASITARAQGIVLLGRVGPNEGALYQETSEGRLYIPLRAARQKDLRVLWSWTWDDVASRTITVEAGVTRWTRVTLDAWVVIQ